jgi:hypothetical protein
MIEDRCLPWHAWFLCLVFATSFLPAPEGRREAARMQSGEVYDRKGEYLLGRIQG